MIPPILFDLRRRGHCAFLELKDDLPEVIIPLCLQHEKACNQNQQQAEQKRAPTLLLIRQTDAIHQSRSRQNGENNPGQQEEEI